MKPDSLPKRVRAALDRMGVASLDEMTQDMLDAIDDVPNVRIVVGTDTNSLQVFVDGKDIARALRVRRLVIEPLECNEMVEATFTVYAQAEVELLPENITVVVTDPESPAYEPNKDKPYTGVVTKP